MGCMVCRSRQIHINPAFSQIGIFVERFLQFRCGYISSFSGVNFNLKINLHRSVENVIPFRALQIFTYKGYMSWILNTQQCNHTYRNGKLWELDHLAHIYFCFAAKLFCPLDTESSFLEIMVTMLPKVKNK